MTHHRSGGDGVFSCSPGWPRLCREQDDCLLFPGTVKQGTDTAWDGTAGELPSEAVDDQLKLKQGDRSREFGW